MKARIVDSAVAGGSDGAIMSTEDAELVIKTIYHRPDTRLASLDIMGTGFLKVVPATGTATVL